MDHHKGAEMRNFEGTHVQICNDFLFPTIFREMSLV